MGHAGPRSFQYIPQTAEITKLRGRGTIHAHGVAEVHDPFVISSDRARTPARSRRLAEAVPHCCPQTVWSVPWTWPQYRLVYDAQATLAAAGALAPLDGGTVELRGLVVGRRHLGQGLATLLVSHLLQCVTKNPRLFQNLGFQPTAPRWLDHDPRRRLGFGGHTPSPRVAMASTPFDPNP